MLSIKEYRVDGRAKFHIAKADPDTTAEFKSKEDAEKRLAENIVRMQDLEGKLYAEDTYSILIIIQAMDTAGKDGAIKHVMSGLNPQGTVVRSFKQPSAEELNHDYLWRAHKALPQRGQIGIFNRSYYEDVLVVRVHELLDKQRLPDELITDDVWERRYRQINQFEKYLTENGTIVLKFFLHISKDEQRKRLLDRINDKSKNWKFSEADLKEREFWDQYQSSYQEAIRKTGTETAPWYVIPANKKWFARLLVSEIIAQTMERLKLKFPTLNKDQRDSLEKYKRKLMKQ
ncbi:MAG TPA: polyphosphate kinase 2 family protein [Bacteroidota bacterium]|nr:polyphosphate kinase 2 family protein [Bacteroidota bacterium]